MGVTHFGQAVDVVKGLSGLALLTGNLGRPNVGIGPVRGQNNVQGSCDHGALPNFCSSGAATPMAPPTNIMPQRDAKKRVNRSDIVHTPS
jgi:anaerobic selenocysteine-containing dehydrogenase